MSNKSLKIFISYSHDDEIHKSWVYQLACDLIDNGIDTILDQWDLSLGENLPKFMEHGLANSDRVLVVCTENYIDKSNEGIGGVGYEKNILTAQLLHAQDTKKFIPIVRNIDRIVKTPICLAGRLYIDFSNAENYKDSLKKLIHEIYGVSLKPKPKLGENPFKKEIDKLPSLNGEKSTVFFSKRFSTAFPGVRGIEWFKEPKVAVDRLSLLFQEPIKFKDGTPICWWRSGDMHIDVFERIDDATILMDSQELPIDEIAAVNAGAYYQSFVYVKTKPAEKSGLYDYSYINESIDYWGYAREEFGIFDGKLISRAEYDDNAAVIDGSPVSLEGKAKIRVRFITPYNFIIAPHDSPINNFKFDRRRDELLTKMLKDESSLDNFVDELMKLPRIERY